MFTSHMTEDELQAVAYRDFLEIRMKVKIAFEQFINRLRLRRGEKRVLHSLIEEKNVLTKSKIPGMSFLLIPAIPLQMSL